MGSSLLVLSRSSLLSLGARCRRRSLISLADTMLLPLSSAARTNRSATTRRRGRTWRSFASRSAFAAHPFPARRLSSSSSTSRTVNKPSPDESTRRTNASTAASTSASPPPSTTHPPTVSPPTTCSSMRHRVGDESIPLKRVQRGIDIRRERHGVQTAVQRERELMQDVFPAVVAEQFVVRLLPRGDVAAATRPIPRGPGDDAPRAPRRAPTTQHAVQQTPDSVRRDHSKWTWRGARRARMFWSAAARASRTRRVC